MADARLSWKDYCERLGEKYEPPHHDPSPILLFLRHPLGYCDLLLHDLAAFFGSKGTVRLLGTLERVGIIIAVVLFAFELRDRESERHNRAWSIIAQARAAEGNIGLRSALETLNSDGVPMHGIRLPFGWVLRARLPGVNLGQSDLTGVIMSYSDLRGANLFGAKLRNAVLVETNLTGANLFTADLRGASLNGANLSEADLSAVDLEGTNLTGVDLEGAFISEYDLDKACVSDPNRQPILPSAVAHVVLERCQ